MQNINSNFFDGQYKDLWRSFIPEELTRRELEFMFEYFKLKPGSEVLDMMCGYGRHAIGLSRKGVVVTAVDNLPDYINDIKEAVLRENLPLTYIHSDIIDYIPVNQFDLVICMGNSLNFFNEEDTQKLMAMVSACLRPGGKFLINSWSVAEIAIPNFTEKSWSYDGDNKILTDGKYLLNPTRIEMDYIMIDKFGTTELRKAIDYIYSLSELQKMLQNTNLTVQEIFSIPGRKLFELGEQRAYIVSQK